MILLTVMQVHPFKWQRDQSLVITTPDKFSAGAVWNHRDYVDKMVVILNILNDTSKLVKLGHVDNHDSRATLETKFQNN